MLEFSILWPSIANGLATGAIYALVALGLTLIYGAVRIISFAHGAALMVARKGVQILFARCGVDPYAALVVPLPNACGACAGYGEFRFGDDDVVVSSTARNFAGPMGLPLAQVHLGSPCTVAASAVAGRIGVPRDLL